MRVSISSFNGNQELFHSGNSVLSRQIIYDHNIGPSMNLSAINDNLAPLQGIILQVCPISLLRDIGPQGYQLIFKGIKSNYEPLVLSLLDDLPTQGLLNGQKLINVLLTQASSSYYSRGIILALLEVPYLLINFYYLLVSYQPYLVY